MSTTLEAPARKQTRRSSGKVPDQRNRSELHREDRLAASVHQSTRPAELSTPSSPRHNSTLVEFFSDFDIEKSLTVVSFLIAAILLAFCLLDLTVGWPLMQACLLFDGIYLACSVALFWLCFDVFKDQTRNCHRRGSTTRSH